MRLSIRTKTSFMKPFRVIRFTVHVFLLLTPVSCFRSGFVHSHCIICICCSGALKAAYDDQVVVNVVCVMNNSRDERCTIYIYVDVSVFQSYSFAFVLIQHAGSGPFSNGRNLLMISANSLNVSFFDGCVSTFEN